MSLPLNEILTLTPGPNRVPEEILQKLEDKYVHPDLDPEFRNLYMRVSERLMLITGSSYGRAYLLPGSGTSTLETALVNLTENGDKVAVFTNGFFGDHAARIVSELNRKPVVVKLDARSTPKETIFGSKAAVIVHCETSRGVLNPIPFVRQLISEETYLIVDAISSLGTVELRMDEWGIDALVGVGHKAFNIPPGLGLLLLSERAAEHVAKNKGGYYTHNLSLWEEFFEENGMTPITPPVFHILVLDVVLEEIIKEGLNALYERHRNTSNFSYEASRILGLKPVPKNGEKKCPSVTALWAPKQSNSSIIQSFLMEKHRILVGLGIGPDREKMLRIGHMGYYAKTIFIKRLYKALADIMFELALIDKRVLRELEEFFENIL